MSIGNQDGRPYYTSMSYPDVTNGEYFDQHHVQALQPDQQHNNFSPLSKNAGSPDQNGGLIPPMPPLRSTNVATYLPMISEEPYGGSNQPLGYLVWI